MINTTTEPVFVGPLWMEEGEQFFYVIFTIPLGGSASLEVMLSPNWSFFLPPGKDCDMLVKIWVKWDVAATVSAEKAKLEEVVLWSKVTLDRAHLIDKAERHWLVPDVAPFEGAFDVLNARRLFYRS